MPLCYSSLADLERSLVRLAFSYAFEQPQSSLQLIQDLGEEHEKTMQFSSLSVDLCFQYMASSGSEYVDLVEMALDLQKQYR